MESSCEKSPKDVQPYRHPAAKVHPDVTGQQASKHGGVSNQFGTLGDDNDGKRSEDEELAFGKLIAEAVEAAVNSDTGKEGKKRGRRRKRRRKVHRQR